MDDTAAARAVIQEYVDACRAGSVERLRAIFHPGALMSGYLMGQCLIGTPQPFYDAVKNSPAAGASDYRAEITAVEVAGCQR
ncbi:MAG: nuclear transport factor 2 family protein [Burkholderiales bacterium]